MIMKQIIRMKKSTVTIVVLILCICRVYAQQDGQFSQYIFNGIYINPAYAGYKEQLNIHSFYRNQWTGIPGAPKSISLAVDAIANNNNVGLALQLSSDRLGAQSNLAGYANYAYRLQLNNDGSSRLAFGVGVGMVRLGIDGAKLTTNDPEPDQPVDMQSTVLPDARAGIYFSDNSYFAGLSVDNLITQYFKTNGYASIPQPKPHYYLTAGMLVPLSEGIVLKPSFLLKDDRAGPTTLDLNAFILLGENIWLGGAYRTGVKLYHKSHLQRDLSDLNAIVGALQIFSINNLRIGYAYDFSIGPLQGGYSRGTHEISIGYAFKTRNTRMLTPRYF